MIGFKDRDFLVKLSLFLVFLFCFFGLFFLKKSEEDKPLNLVIISIDALRPDHMGAYGYAKDTTPHIDTLAKESLLFQNLRTMIPMTYPSFTTLMTGKDPIKTRVIRNRGILVSPNNKTLASILKDNGYVTAAFLTGALNPKSTNLDQGLDDEDFLAFKGYLLPNAQERYYQTSRESYEEFIADSLKWITKNKDHKFFYWIHLMDPHAPYEPPKDLTCKFGEKYCSQILQKSARELETDRMQYQKCQDEPAPEDAIGKEMTLYDGGIAYSDRLMGLVYQKIKDLHLDKNTVVMIYGDHGEGFDHNYYFNHRDVLYDSSIRIPLIIKLPGATRQQVIDENVQNKDILPTLLSLLKVGYNPARMDGKNVLDSFTNLSLTLNPQKNLTYFYNSTFTKFAVFDGQYKLIYSTQQTCLFNNQTEELYDITHDPGELKNLVTKNTERTKYLKNALLDYLSEYNLPFAPRVNVSNPVSSSSAKKNDLENNSVDEKTPAVPIY